MQFFLEKVNISKKDDCFLFELKSIKMITPGENKHCIMMIPKKKDESLNAVNVIFKMINDKIERIKIKIEGTLIEVSMAAIDELIEVLNVPIILSNYEHKEFKKFLKENILQSDYKEIKGNFNALFESLFGQKELSLRNTTSLRESKRFKTESYMKNYELELTWSELTIRLLEKNVYLFYYHYLISLKKHS